MSTTDENILKRASKQQKALYQLPIGHQLLETLQAVGPNTLLLGLRENSPQLKFSEYWLVQADSGSILWRYPCDKGEYSAFWVSDSNIVLKKDEKKKISLIGLDLDTGNALWEKTFPTAKNGLMLEPETENLINYTFDKGSIVISSIALKDGTTNWENQLSADWETPPFLIIEDEKVFVFSNALTVMDLRNGTKVFDVEALGIKSLDPLLPSFDEQHLFLLDEDGKLVCMDKRLGRILWKQGLPESVRVTNISSSSKEVYVRGEDKNLKFHLFSFSKNEGTSNWNITCNEGLTSNLLEDGENLFFASYSKLYAVDVSTGEPKFTKSVTKTGRSFPIALRLTGDKVVFIGELVVAGYDATSGKLAYRYGFSPIDINLHFNGLDASLPKLRQQLGNEQDFTPSGVAEMASNRRAYYQKMSDTNYSDYLKYRRQTQPGSGFKANRAWNRSQLYSNMARMQSALSVSFALIELGSALEQVMQANATQAEIRKQEYYRKSILDVYSMALSEDYVFRPNLKYFDTDDEYVCVSLIKLASGKKQDYLLSPQYLEYGLWNLIDFERGVIYHHGVGMNPEKYKVSKSKRTPLVRFKTVETFLVAQPINLN